MSVRLFASTWAPLVVLLLAASAQKAKTQATDSPSQPPGSATDCLTAQAELAAYITGERRFCEPSAGSYTSIASNLTTLLEACNPRGEVVKLRPLRIIADDIGIGLWTYLGSLYKNLTGLEVQFKYVDYQKIIPEVLFAFANNAEFLYDGYVVFGSLGLVDLYEAGALADLRPFIERDTKQWLEWPDVTPYFREVLNVHNKQIVTLPFAALTATMFYRKDIFEKHGIPAPETWEEMMAVAAAWNATLDIDGDGVLDPSLCTDYTVDGSQLVTMIMTPVFQSKGYKQGFLFDVPSLEPLVDNAGMERVWNIWRNVSQYCRPVYGVTYKDHLNTPLIQGKCLMMLSAEPIFKSLAFYPGMAGGKLGVKELPGSEFVYDRPSRRLLPCNENTCSSSVVRNGTVKYFNRAPFTPEPGAGLGVNPKVEPAYQQAAYDLITLLAGRDISDAAMVFNPMSMSGTFRESGISPASIPRWQAVGYQRVDVEEFQRAIRATWDDPNIAKQLRIKGAAQFRQILSQAAAQVAGPALGQPMAASEIPALMARVRAEFEAVINASGGRAELAKGYLESLDYVAPPPPLPPPGPLMRHGSGLSNGTVAAIAAPLSALGAVLLAGLLMWLLMARNMAKSKHRALLTGKVMAPGPGPGTTLLVSDIQDSTVLWETLPLDIMDSALRVHHATMRATLVEHSGYESATEGDSFILAFWSPQDAVAFAAAAQQALLNAQWPADLLEQPACRAVFLPAPRNWSAATSADATDVAGLPKRRLLRTVTSILQQLAVNGSAQSSRSLQASQASANFLPAPADLQAAYLSTQSSSHPQNDMYETSVSLLGASAVHPAPSTFGLGPVSTEEASSDQVLGAPDRVTTGGLHRQLSDMVGQAQKRPKAVGGARPSTPGGKQAPAGPGNLPELWGWAVLEEMTLTCRSGAAPVTPGSPPPPGAVLVWRGLRVRMGMHSGIEGAADVTQNKATGRAQYSGEGAALAKAVQDCAQGGMVLLSAASFSQLRMEELRGSLLVAHMGEHDVYKGKPAMALYVATPHALVHRLAEQGPVRSIKQVLPGWLAAPYGYATICFMHAAGVPALMAWSKEHCDEALALYQRTAHAQLAATGGGYLVEAAEGLCLAAFARPDAAMRWALATLSSCHQAPWDAELLAHDMGEEVTMRVPDGQGGVRTITLYRGLRLRAGIDAGAVMAHVHPTWCRMAYTGRTMNRAARISSKARSGQVWCSQNAWAAAEPYINMQPVLSSFSTEGCSDRTSQPGQPSAGQAGVKASHEQLMPLKAGTVGTPSDRDAPSAKPPGSQQPVVAACSPGLSMDGPLHGVANPGRPSEWGQSQGSGTSSLGMTSPWAAQAVAARPHEEQVVALSQGSHVLKGIQGEMELMRLELAPNAAAWAGVDRSDSLGKRPSASAGSYLVPPSASFLTLVAAPPRAPRRGLDGVQEATNVPVQAHVAVSTAPASSAMTAASKQEQLSE